MDKQQIRYVAVSILLVMGLWAGILLFGGNRESVPEIRPQATRFEAARALQYTREFVTRFPRRVIGSIESRQSTGYLQQRLSEAGFTISYEHFDTVIGGRRETARNVLAFRQGQTEEILAVLSHYDTTATVQQGAMDNGSGIGVMLELARSLSAAPTRRSLLLVATDGGEWGLLGARDLLESYAAKNRIAAAVSLDYVALGRLAALKIDTIGQFGGYAPPWLRELARACAAQSGLPVEEAAGMVEYMERALPISAGDQGPFLRAGIPAVNLGSRSQDAAREAEVHHSAADVVDNLEAASFDAYGRAAERIIMALDALTAVPPPAPGGVHLRGSYYLPDSRALMLHYVSFLPLALILLFHLLNHHAKMTPRRLQREALEIAAALTPVLAAYGTIFLLKALRILPAYTLYPPPSKDPILSAPAWGVLGTLGIVLLLGGAISLLLRRLLLRSLPEPDYHVSKIVNMTLLLLVILVSLQYNSFWALVFLALPALSWGMVPPGSGVGGRAANRIIILAGWVVAYAVIYGVAARFGIGWKVVWLGLLAMANGVFQSEGSLLVVATIVLGIRFLAIQSMPMDRGSPS